MRTKHERPANFSNDSFVSGRAQAFGFAATTGLNNNILRKGRPWPGPTGCERHGPYKPAVNAAPYKLAVNAMALTSWP